MNLSSELHKLRKLHDEGNLTDEEYVAAKAKLLDISKDDPSLENPVLSSEGHSFEGEIEDEESVGVEHTISLEGRNARDFSFTVGQNRKRLTGFFSDNGFVDEQRGHAKITFVK